MPTKQSCLKLLAVLFLISFGATVQAQAPLYGNFYGQPNAQANRIYQQYSNFGIRVFNYHHHIGARAFGWRGSQPGMYYQGYYPNYYHRPYYW